MTDTAPHSAGETPAAPPDPWKAIEQLQREARRVGWDKPCPIHTSPEPSCGFCVWMAASSACAALATERQHHAAREVELFKEWGVENEAKNDALEDLTAARAEIASKDEEIKLLRRMELRERLAAENARAEIARLTEDAICATEQQNAAVLRAEAAEAALLAIRAAHDRLSEQVRLALTFHQTTHIHAVLSAALAASPPHPETERQEPRG